MAIAQFVGFLARLAFYGGIGFGVGGCLYYGKGIDKGQLIGFRKGYAHCEQIKNIEIERIANKSYDDMNKIYAKALEFREDVKKSLDDLVREKEFVLKKREFTEQEIVNLLTQNK
ncbi:MAG: hypothetical protein QW559_00860 [Candidatus Woesearchaeota archaeon]